ncbi:hypothetical protein [uncultured Litoreibacter sp.]|nr:hypothetical protein [uncultured Litoreibacter sp.]
MRKPAKASKPKFSTYSKPRKRRKPAKKLRSFLSDIVEEAWDFAEDIFD